MIEPIFNRNFGNTFQHRMDQISVNFPTKIPVNRTNTETLVKNINTDIFRYPGPHQSHT